MKILNLYAGQKVWLDKKGYATVMKKYYQLNKKEKWGIKG